MFRRPHKVKTSTALKGSERRKLRSLIENHFPDLPLDDFIPGKCDIIQVKALTHSGAVALIYCLNKNPIFFLIEECLYPSVYTLWMYPNLLPNITTVPAVLDKICNGADLMAPGIVISDKTLQEMQKLKKMNICAVKLLGNKSAIAIGKTLMSVDDMSSEGIKGKAVAIIHYYKDYLWQSGSCLELPVEPDTSVSEIMSDVENITLSEDVIPSNEENDCNSSNMEDNFLELSKEDEQQEEIVPEYTMDDILYSSFITAIKVYGKKIALPILTSTFYSSYVLKSCPPQLNLDIKKSTYKKLSVFLKKMQKEGILVIKELSKGVESITSMNINSEHVLAFKIDSVFKKHIETVKSEQSVNEEPSSVVQDNYKFPSVMELFVVSAQVKSIFEFFGIKKGDTVPITDVRNAIKYYVKENSLQDDNPRFVKLDPILCDCISKKGSSLPEKMTWEELQESIISKMPNAYQIVFDGKEPVVKKGKLELIQITIDTRTGNKKVTLIQNLEIYGINPEKLAHHVQVSVAASTSVTSTQNGKGTVVLIQGNQVLYLQTLFLDIYKIPRKYIRGLENVPKKK